MSKKTKQVVPLNPLVSDCVSDSLRNSRDALEFIQSSTLGSFGSKINLSEQATSGLYYLMLCVRDALEFEIERVEYKENSE